IAHRVAGAGVERDLVAGGYAYEDVPTRSWHPHDTRPVAGVEVARPLDVFVNVLEDLAEGHVLAEGLKELLHVLLPRAGSLLVAVPQVSIVFSFSMTVPT